MKTIIGVFDDALEARRAMETLRDGPLMLDDVSIITRAGEGQHDSTQDVGAGEGAAVGAVWGGLVGLAALLIPGVGPFIAGGALFAALTGAVTGAVVGGISAALIDFSGIGHEEAAGYESDVRSGRTLIAVKARDEDAAEVQRILSSSGADQVRGDQVTGTAMANPPARVMMYDEQGQRVEQAHEVGATTSARAASTTTTMRGVYDYPGDRHGTTGQRWTRGEWVGEGQGEGRETNTGSYDARQWVGEGQGEGPHRSGEAWTSGEFVGEGQGEGPHKDTGTYDSRQWVGEGQGKHPSSDDTTKS
jgi:uncharacterized membrane protein